MKLIIELNNTKPIELIDFAISLNAIGAEYNQFALANGVIDDTSKLVVREVRKGSTILDLIPFMPYVPDIVGNYDLVIGYAKHIQDVVNWILEKAVKPKYVSNKTLNNISNFVNPVAKDNGSQINIGTANIKSINIENMVLEKDSDGANVIQNKIRHMIESSVKKNKEEKVLLKWAQVKNAKKGDFGIIESLSDFPVRTYMNTNQLKVDMVFGVDYPFNKGFVVDVEIETVDGNPKLYKISKLHEIIDI